MSDQWPNLDDASVVQVLVRSAIKASLGTIEKGSGHPYISLVATATDPEGRPLLQLSKLARHTQNILNDPRVSLLFDGTGTDKDPLAGFRVTLLGVLELVEEPRPLEITRRRFLAKHPAAVQYMDFADFSFFRLNAHQAHLIGGFGRIVTLEAERLTIDCQDADQIVDAEPETIAQLNTAHADAISICATALLGADSSDGPWLVTGIDPAGLDIHSSSRHALRLMFPEPANTPEAVRRTLLALAQAASVQK